VAYLKAQAKWAHVDAWKEALATLADNIEETGQSLLQSYAGGAMGGGGGGSSGGGGGGNSMMSMFGGGGGGGGSSTSGRY